MNLDKSINSELSLDKCLEIPELIVFIVERERALNVMHFLFGRNRPFLVPYLHFAAATGEAQA